MSLSLALLPAEAVDATGVAINESLMALPTHQRSFVHRQLHAAVAAGLLDANEVIAALSHPRSASALLALGGTLLRRFATRCMSRTPTLDATAVLPAGAAWLGDPAARSALRFWLQHLHDHGAISAAQIRGALGEGDRAVLTLAAEGWAAQAESIAKEVRRGVGPATSSSISLYVYPSVFDGAGALERERGPAGVVIDSTPPLLFTLDHLDRHATDTRLPLVMAGIKAIARRIRSFEVVTPVDVLDGEQMYDEMLGAIQYQAADALQPDGSIRIPDLLIEQLGDEFGIDIDGEHDPFRPKIEKALAYYNDPGVLAVAEIEESELVGVLNVAARRGGKVGAVLKVLAKAIAYLDLHAVPRAELEYSAPSEECYLPALVISADHTGLEEGALYNRFISVAESGGDFVHILDSDTRPGDAALLALRESCCIASVISALDKLNA